ncbi:MAG: hypothetical protein JOZ41_21055 [Chloroflexi bacterium]|nr:hypothetical protein [Chloroflexota bacterium]
MAGPARGAALRSGERSDFTLTRSAGETASGTKSFRAGYRTWLTTACPNATRYTIQDSIVFLDGAGMLASIDLRGGSRAWSFRAHHAHWSPVPAVAMAGVGMVVGTSCGRPYLIALLGRGCT